MAIEPQQYPFDWDELLTCLSEGCVIPLIGKELVTVEIDGKVELLDYHLARRLAADLGVQSDAGDYPINLNDMTFRYLRAGGDHRKVYPKIKTILDKERFPVPGCLKKLAAIRDFRLYVSLTFDTLLEQALTGERAGEGTCVQSLVYSLHRKIEDLPDESAALGGVFVYHLFGQASSTTDYAVTDEDHLEFIHSLQREDKRPKNLFDEFRNNHLLFLGCGYQNWLERFFIRTVRDERMLNPREASELVVDDESRRDLSLTVFLQQYKTDVFLAGDACLFVDELHRRWTERHPVTAPERAVPLRAGGPMPTEAIFLSYTREDGDTVLNMKRALEEAGLDVWFDQTKDDLLPGADWEQEIRSNIKRCAVFIPFLSCRAEGKREGYFRREWKWAIVRDEGMDPSRRFIQPVVVDNLPNEAPGIPDEFWKKQCSRFPNGTPDPDFVRQLRELVKSLREKQVGYE
jgi:hypothetical protein